MFRTLIYPSSGAYDYSVELPHWSCVLGSMCVGFSVWLVWHGIRFAGNYYNDAQSNKYKNLYINLHCGIGLRVFKKFSMKMTI